jgi:hypothetical protein
LPLPDNTSSEALTVLATHADYYVRKNVAANSYTPSEVLDTLATDISDDVVEAVAGNGNTTAATLTAMVSRPVNRSISIALAANPNTPPTALDGLAAHSWHGVITEVLLNPSTGVGTLMKLINTPSAAATIALRNTDLVPALERIEETMSALGNALLP